MLKINSLQTTVGDHKLKWSFSVPTGSFTAIVGPSGVGKSTLLKSLIGLLPDVAGSVDWLGNEINKLEVFNRPFGILFQENNLFDHLSVHKNLQLGLRSNAKLSDEQERLLTAACERFNLTELKHKKASELSGGQVQRVALARVFLQNKPVLLLDEPFSSLNPELRKEGITWVKDIQKQEGTTVLLVTHHLEEVLGCADFVYVGYSNSRWELVKAEEYSLLSKAIL